MTDDLFDAPSGPRPGAAPARKCRRHMYAVDGLTEIDSFDGQPVCARCGKVKDATTSKRNKNNGKRGRSDELRVARILGGNKLGQLGLPWDVEIPGYLRVQCKQLDTWPSIAKVIEWLDAIPGGHELRAVTLADTPGAGGRTRRLIVMELEEYARWHGKA